VLVASERDGTPIEVELWQLEQPHADLRIITQKRVAELCASLLEHGQKTPLLVVPSSEPNRYVLIDGHARARAMKRARLDTARALVLGLGAAEALALAYRLESTRRRSALEEGWLVRELCAAGKRKLGEVADQLERSKSWVSRRLGLVQELPESVQALVRAGAVSPHAAMKSLLPLARANARAAERIGEISGREQLPSRAVDKLCRAWRAAQGEQREKLLREPLLYLQVEEQLGRAKAQAAQPPLVRDFELLAAVARRSERLLRQAQEQSGAPEALTVVWPRTENALARLDTAVKEAMDAGFGHTTGDSPAGG
jgi:ParB/RepB/Spo0J family partition protein